MGSNPIPSILVFDTSTLQGAYRGGVLDALRASGAGVLLPKAVAEETRAYHARPGAAGRVPDLDAYPWIASVEVTDDELRAAGAVLVGSHRETRRFRIDGRLIERPDLEAVLLAAARKAALVIEDDVPRRLARERGIDVLGVAALLERLHATGDLCDPRGAARKILATGYHQEDLLLLAHPYDHREIEARWQRVWAQRRVFEAGRKPGSEKFYVLEMFPYPSGAMHMGHARVYAIGDVIARVARMQGRDVLHPMGYDALGLPVENAAIKEGAHPAIRTKENIASFGAEMRSMGFSFDWSREFATSDPAYYRWNQWFFVKMFERGLIYRRQGWVNWCPTCATVLANEQVEDGACWRGHPGVVRKQIGEWAFRITRYADELLRDLDKLGGWPERVTAMQRNWIGRSEGAEIEFPVVGSREKIRVFTTRLDTIFGCTYVVVAPEHPLAARIAAPGERAALAEFAARLGRQSEVDRTAGTAVKEGIDTGARAVNPFTGEEVPVWAANFVLAEYGTGAVMSVPAHDQRDFEFAKKYGLPIRVVVQPAEGAPIAARALEGAFTEDGLLVASGEATGLSSKRAREALAKRAEAEGSGRAVVTWHLRDWGFSRQRYWGTPIPIIWCERCGEAGEPAAVPVPVGELPVLLPAEAPITGTGEPPLAKVPEFVETRCPRCGGPAKRDPETMDTFVVSSWYFARYLSPNADDLPFARAAADRWLPIDVYVGGPEHAVLHLLYFRFWTKVMADLGLCSAREPAVRLVTQGIVLGPDGEKMSKSRGNVVSPRRYVEKYGADTTRLFVLFAGPVEHDFAWNDAQVEGLHRFLARVWRLAGGWCEVAREAGAPEPSSAGRALALRRIAHRTLKRVTEDVARLHFNTAIAALMEHVNALSELAGEGAEPILERAERAALAEAVEVLAIGLSPFAPHFAEEVWAALGHRDRCLQEIAWPAFDPALLAEETRRYAVQVGGKLRGEVTVAADAGQREVEEAARADARIAAHFAGKTIRKVVFVPKRLVNFVVG